MHLVGTGGGLRDVPFAKLQLLRHHGRQQLLPGKPRHAVRYCWVQHSQPARNHGLRSRHPNGVNVAMCDGSVQFITSTIGIAVWQAMSTTQGNEIIGSY